MNTVAGPRERLIRSAIIMMREHGVAATGLTELLAHSKTHLHWCRLAELTDGYRDLITDVTEHRRRLPVW
ncbi:hypothetical protein ACFWFL_25630, partial [Nocardia asteroides]